MPFGHNSNVRAGGILYHIQTEDRGAHHPFIDTTVYCQGRVLHRRSTNYDDILGMGEGLESFLQRLVEEQHRSVVEEIRAGTLALSAEQEAWRAGPGGHDRREVGAPEASAAPPEGLRLRLQNAGTWLSGGNATLKVQVLAKNSEAPIEGAEVEARIEGAATPTLHKGFTDSAGQTEISFPMPRFGPEGGALAIRASGTEGQDEIRYLLRAKPHAPAPADVR
jgi:hypothetical protein